ncbi:MAG TPA: hypothetical protein VK203_31115 [Nostocaceae cyanobacterium]|nr:hypothetical protein [Nostocaceae cyanobacterium]
MYKDSKQSWSYDAYFNPHIDFCVWVLKKDGIRFAPFNQHPEGDGKLRDAGLKPEAWFTWFNKVVATQNPILLSPKNVTEYQAMIERNLISLREAKAHINLKIDEASERARLESQMHQHVQQYQLAANQAAPFLKNSEPPTVWQGSATIKTLLWELWHDYQNIREEESFQDWVKTQQDISIFERIRQSIFEHWQNINNILNGSLFGSLRLYQNLQKYSHILPTLNVYKIHYPGVIEYTVPPTSIIISNQNGVPYTNLYRQSVLRTVKTLVSQIN